MDGLWQKRDCLFTRSVMENKEILESGQKVLDFLQKKEYVDVRFTGKIFSEINCRNGGVSDVTLTPKLIFRGINENSKT